MKTKTVSSEPKAVPFSQSPPATSALRLKELQGSFAIEGIEISDDALQQHAVNYTKLKQSGEAQRRIAKVVGRKR